MRLLYDFGVWFYGSLLRLLSPFHNKAKLWVEGHKNIFQRLEQSVEKGHQYIWFHFASLGEFEQGRAVLEQIKKSFPQEKIIITFYSPSGYEIRKNTPLADLVFYLPEDTAAHAQRFIELIHPKFVVFTKYEYWYHYFNQLHKRGITLLVISCIFREDQIFFKPYGTFFKQILQKVTYFFAQNTESVQMLKWIKIHQAGLAGDTRFDRVVELPLQRQAIPAIEQFVGGHQVVVAGSTWKPDEELLATLLQRHSTWKCILAPHEIDSAHISELTRLFPAAIVFSRFSSYSTEQIEQAQVMIIDNIGMLSSLYYYGDIAYIGGGFGVGIHNTLEAATYGIPVVFGPKYEKYKEAVDLVTIHAAFSITDFAELNNVFEEMQTETTRIRCGKAAQGYVKQNAGATKIIMKYLTTQGLLS